MFDNLYMLDGTLYIVTTRPLELPNTKYIISTGEDIMNGEAEARARLPSEKEIRVISPEEARGMFGGGASRLQGVTVRLYRAFKSSRCADCCWLLTVARE